MLKKINKFDRNYKWWWNKVPFNDLIEKFLVKLKAKE
jgi:hypothetical protein